MTKFSSPVSVGARYTSAYGRRWGTLHAGDDYAPIKPGDHDPIYAAADGVVYDVGTGILKGHTGRIIIIDHGLLTGNGSSDYTMTNYGHMSKIIVEPGQRVQAGQLIGYMGATGNVTGVHVHAGVRFKKKGTKSYKWSSFHKWMKSKGITPGKTAPRESGAKYSKEIADWQRSMNKVFPSYANFAVDGKYEDYSEKVTRDFQTRVGIKATGKLDSKTKTYMRRYGVDI